MIDIKLIRENKDLVKENIKKKFQDAKLPLVDEIYDLDGNLLDAARHPLQMVKFKCKHHLKPYDLLRLGD